jgi:peptide deformylase
MVVPIILYGSQVLRKHSLEITEEDNISEISEMLFDTLKKAEGIGLACPQINLLKRAFAIDTSPLITKDITIEKFERVFINPVILCKSKEVEIYNEGCLSIPGIYEEVIRPYKIRVRYQDISLITFEEDLDGLKARIFQHELDHLSGILFIDKLNLLRRKLIAGKLRKIKKLN